MTSLHDGMNLVCKAFVAARDDEQGVLVLSRFAGAAHELTQALVVNPHHITQVAQAMHPGLAMPAAEQSRRMRALRNTVKLNHVFRCGARMLLDAASLRDGRAGVATLRRMAAHHSALVFDLDGNLAPLAAGSLSTSTACWATTAASAEDGRQRVARMPCNTV